MKKLIYNNKEYIAEKIIKTYTDIIGKNGDIMVFAFKGIKDFTQFQLEEGKEWDVDENVETQNRINELELYILSQEGLI